MGFYSTLASSSLVDRLKQHQADGRIRQYEIIDHKKIEARFVSAGLSKLAFRYFPTSYGMMRPIQKIIGEYIPLHCEICGKDTLQASLVYSYGSILVCHVPRDNLDHVEHIYMVCKGECDHRLQQQIRAKGGVTKWEDLGDLTNPATFLRNMIVYMNQLRGGVLTYSDEAHEKMKEIYIASAQRTLREATDQDYERLKLAIMLDGL